MQIFRYMETVTENTPEYLLSVMAQVVEGLLLKLNVPLEEAEGMAEQIKERRMGEWCANFKGYDVQATRQAVRDEDIVEVIGIMKELSASYEFANQQLINRFKLEPQVAEEKLKANW